MADRVRLPFAFDVAAMQREVRQLERDDNWIDHFIPKNYSGSWSVIPLRADAAATHPVQMIFSNPTATEFVDTRFLDQCPYLRSVISLLAVTVDSARLMRLEPGSSIHEHRDLDLDSTSAMIRLHIPITTNRDVEFLLNGTSVPMREGECWYLRLSDPHSVANRGATDRVHLVVDAHLNDWMREQLASAPRAIDR